MKKLLSSIIIALFFTMSHAKDGSLTLNIEGMTCPNCAASIESELEKVEEVRTVKIDLSQKQAIVTLNDGARIVEQKFQKAVQKAGFKLISMSQK